MQNSLSQALENIRLNSVSEFEKGEYFERLVKVFLENDNLHTQTLDKIWHFKDWAKEFGKPSNDTGIDLVGRHADGLGFCAIQCKFYASDSSISKKHIDSFVSAASTADFVSLVIVDTTLKDFSPNLKAMLDNLDRDWHRIALTDLEKSRIDWASYFRDQTVRLEEPKKLRDHQREALEAVRSGLAEADRGKLIMACGTGKTFTGLKIAEELGGKGAMVLYMVPSLALMSQTVREWKNDCDEEFLAFSVCSDVKVGKRQGDGDAIQFTVHDLAFPATTDAGKIAGQIATADRDKMTVVFSTYQSIQTISDAQKSHGLPEFDWIICDEAHRTTGATIEGEDESNFVRIHSNEHVKGKKRLYMTATPKIYGENAKSKAKQHDVELASMDDETKFGKVLFHRGFSWAVENNLLSDYKVIVLAVDEGLISSGVQTRLTESSEMKLDDATKIIGCYKALTKHELIGEKSVNPQPMKRALAFCKNIAVSKMVTEEFSEVVEEYSASDLVDDGRGPVLDMQLRHVDGTYNNSQCFPLKLYEPASADDGLFATGETGYTERDGISDAGLKHFQDAYAGEQISKEDLFYYIYGLLHSPDYRERFKNNLSKELPRIPAVKTAADFWAFSKAGRALGDLHVNYGAVEPYPVVIKEGDLRLADIPNPETFYRVEKMKFGGKGKVKDKTTVQYNARITMTGIPLAAYDYVVNGKPALEWVMERQCVKTDKASGIVNDANRYAIETVGNPAYPLELFQRVITVSLETMKIVNGLPKLDID
ncbi:type ISP restriction/modification enzyme [Neptunicoccus cionae]|uniref:type ISP restriction/modification enzyme n=1 Tax=Neptunicoccus cionae TaxID=2035344 RepID=UPI000C766547|nr:type ISP restriction/modification enzyme [Amylibacter cionae]PLS20460.1 hypothetical protein C0U40_17690 [Amylibacter cionae]